MLDELAGRRVSLRHRIAPETAPGPGLTDAVGELEHDGPDAVVVHTRSGPVRVRRDAVVAVREVPPAPARRASRAAVDRLERVRAAAWPAPVVEELGGWLLRAAGGWTRRANSALALGDPGMPVERALERVRGFAGRHGIAPAVQAPVDAPWSNRVAEAGWVRDASPGTCTVLVTGAASDGPAPRWPATPGPGWWAAQGEPEPPPGAPAWAVLTGVLRPGEQSAATRSDPVPIGFGTLHDGDGTPVASVRAAVVDAHVYVSRLWVVPAARRGGHASRLTREALAWGAAHGARHGMLDVADDNTAALALYRGTGWTDHHRYHYLVPAD
ncbi:N-acetyltransferase [Pseudonocardia sp. ICBG1293]|uniref:GNAT family N-acetyltransferase n=1 Tax=Pseudonocardia sp. ICBG1293 TaxID=2844382 RepID=UPI001CCEA8E7|nr:GNAT family N-acetyltransferase [Pseudonocardia sp. ICBG1293]